MQVVPARVHDPNLLTGLSESFRPDLVDSALVDIQGDEEYELSEMIDFEPGRHLKTAGKLLDALNYLLEQTVDMDMKYGIGLSEGEEDARTQALAAIAEATGA